MYVFMCVGIYALMYEYAVKAIYKKSVRRVLVVCVCMCCCREYIDMHECMYVHMCVYMFSCMNLLPRPSTRSWCV